MKDVDETTVAALGRYRFDGGVFEKLRASLRASGAAPDASRLDCEVTAPVDTDLAMLPASDSAQGMALVKVGKAALARGEVGVIVLAGGMATRMGSVVKAAVEVVPGETFLSLKLADIARVAAAASTTVPVFLMASFATGDEIRRVLGAAPRPRTPVEVLEQSVTLRLLPDGEIFRDGEGRPSLCATGHGDLLPTLRASGALARFRRAGGRMLMVSNVDNLAATLDPRVIGAHCHGGKAVTVEVVRKESGDRGGIPARVGGHLQIVEEFRLPAGFDGNRVPFFNTNTFMLDAAAIERDFELDWFLVRRKVEGRECIQAERLLGQVTAYLPTQFLIVERHGRDGRFLPVKDRDELQAQMPEIETLLRGLDIAR